MGRIGITDRFISASFRRNWFLWNGSAAYFTMTLTSTGQIGAKRILQRS